MEAVQACFWRASAHMKPSPTKPPGQSGLARTCPCVQGRTGAWSCPELRPQASSRREPAVLVLIQRCQLQVQLPELVADVGLADLKGGVRRPCCVRALVLRRQDYKNCGVYRSCSLGTGCYRLETHDLRSNDRSLSGRNNTCHSFNRSGGRSATTGWNVVCSTK